MTPEVDQEELEIQRELEEERADAIAHGMRLIEKYHCAREVREEDFRDPQVMEVLTEATRVQAMAGIEDEGYEAVSEPTVEVIPHLFGGRVIDLGNGRSVTYVAQIVATIRGYKP